MITGDFDAPPTMIPRDHGNGAGVTEGACSLRWADVGRGEVVPAPVSLPPAGRSGSRAPTSLRRHSATFDAEWSRPRRGRPTTTRPVRPPMHRERWSVAPVPHRLTQWQR